MANQIVSHNGISYELRSVASSKVLPSGKLTPIGLVPVPVIKGEMFSPDVADVFNGLGVDVELAFSKAVDGLAIYLQAAARAAVESKEPSQIEVFMAGASMTDDQLNGAKRGSPEHLALAKVAVLSAKNVEKPDPAKVWWELLPKLLDSTGK